MPFCFCWPVMHNGHIKLWRKSLDTRIFRNAELWKVWCWCLLKASYKKRWATLKTGKGEIEIELLPGQFIFGRDSAAKELNMPASSIRNRIEKLKKLQNLAIKPDRQYSIITIINWDIYQPQENKTGQAEGQAKDRQRTGKGHKQEGKEGKEEKKNNKKKSFKTWTEDDFRNSVTESNHDELLFENEIEDFISYWTEPSASGLFKFAMQKTWDTRRRMNNALKLIFEKRREKNNSQDRKTVSDFGVTQEYLESERKRMGIA